MSVCDSLANALMEMLAVVGLDESTSFESMPSPDDTDACSFSFTPQILAALSRHVALQMPFRPDDSYPPQSHKSPSLSESSTLVKKPPMPNNIMRTPSTSSSTGRPVPSADGAHTAAHSNDKFQRHQPCRRTLTPVDLVRQGAGKTIHPQQFPLSDESLKSLTMFCFPDGCQISAIPQSDSVHHLALTNISGSRMYAVCMTHYEKHSMSRGRSGTWKCAPRSSTLFRVSSGQSRTAYVPRSYVFISKYPYLTSIKDCLSRLMVRLRNCSDDWWQIMKEFALQMTMTPVPLGSTLQLEFQLFDTIITLPATCYGGRQPLDFDIGIIFSCLDPQAVLLIITALLTQQRIVYTSSSYSLLVLVAESFLYLLHPFRWQLTYVPLLPPRLLELLEAPGTFIMGCHSKHRSTIDNIPDLIVVNLDQGAVHIPNSVEIPCMPKTPAASFKDSIKHLLCHLNVWRLESPTTFTYEESRTVELEHCKKSNQAVSHIFLDLMAHLFCNVLKFVNREKRFFHKNQFLDEVGDVEKPFYERVFTTDLFNAFLKDRLNDRSDEWMDTVRRSRFRRGSSSGLNILPTDRGAKMSLLRNARSMTSLELCGTESGSSSQNLYSPIIFRLPNFMYSLSHLYFDACFKAASTAVENVEKAEPFSDKHGAFLFLRGSLYLARSDLISGLSDFCEIHVINCCLFPGELVANILSMMSEKERVELEASDVYRRYPVLKDTQRLYTGLHWSEQSIVMDLDKIPEQQIDLAGFEQLLKMLQISEQPDVAERLFNALTLERSTVVDPVTFKEFYKCWKQNEVEALQLAISEDVLGNDETVIKVSDLIRCSVGMGHVLLTQDRLLFLEDGSHRCREILQLLDIRRVELQVPKPSFFKTFTTKPPMLKIYLKDEKHKPFTASFRDELPWWHMYVSEMWAGKVYSEEMRNLLVRHLAMQNVLIVDAYLHSAEIETCSHHKDAMEQSVSLCYYMTKMAEVEKCQSPTVSDILVRFLNVTACDVRRQCVESLLYTQARGGKMDDDEVVSPRVWCGLSSGKLLVYNALTWQLEPGEFNAGKRIACLLESNLGQIWAGSHDCAVYVIDNSSVFTFTGTLLPHTDAVVDITIDGPRMIFTASIDGQICAWSPSSKARRHKMNLKLDGKPLRKIQCHDSKLYCCDRHKIHVLSLEGALITRVSVPNDGQPEPLPIDCFVFGPRNELWVGLGKQGQVNVYDMRIDHFELRATITIQSLGISTLIRVGGQVWIGAKEGVVYTCNGSSYCCERELKVHSDRITSICTAPNQFVFTGSGSTDGKIAVWKWPMTI